MKTNLSIVVAVWVALSLAGCGSSRPQDLILGKWAAGQGGIKVEAEFARDGTATLTMFGQPLRGTYQFDGSELVWTVNGITTKHKAKVSATELEVTGDDGMTIIYKRESE